MASLIIVEDHPVVREGVRALLKATSSHEIVGECEDGLTAMKLIEKMRPDVAVVDLRLPGLDGLEVIRRATREFPSTRIVVLSMHASESFVSRAIDFGALGYVLKNSDVGELKNAIDAALVGRQYISRAVSGKDIRQPVPPDRYDLLSAREREVLQLIADGEASQGIANRLFISVRTVEKHRSNIMKKLELRNNGEVVRYALQRELTPLTSNSSTRKKRKKGR